MKRALLFVSGLILMVSCSTPQAVSVGTQKPNSSRVAYIYEDKVVIVTKSEFTREQYAQMLALTENKEK
jgi:hypothetical protein